MTYHPTPAFARTSHTPSPVPEPFDPTLTPLQVFQRIWDSFYVGLDPITLTEDFDDIDEERMAGRGTESGKGGWDTQICSMYLSELRVDVQEYWTRCATAEMPGPFQLPLGEDSAHQQATNSSPSGLGFTFESFPSPLSASSDSVLAQLSTITHSRSPAMINPIERKYEPHVAYTICAPISENILGPSCDSLQGGAVVQRVEFVPFADDERFLVLSNEKGDEKTRGYLDLTFGTQKNGFRDATEWTWITEGDDPDCKRPSSMQSPLNARETNGKYEITDESIQLETVRRLHHQYYLSLDDISRALPGFGRVVVDDEYGAISIDPGVTLGGRRKRQLAWLKPRDTHTLSWTGALPESGIPPLTIGYLKELFSMREVQFNEGQEKEKSEGWESESDDNPDSEDFRRSKAGLKRKDAKGKAKAKQRSSYSLSSDDLFYCHGEGLEDPEEDLRKPLHLVTGQTLFDEIQRGSGVWCSNVECMRVYRVSSPATPSSLQLNIHLYTTKKSPPYKYSSIKKSNGKAKARGKEEECGEYCFRHLVPSDDDRGDRGGDTMPATDGLGLLWPADSTDLSTLESILHIEPDALPCYLAGIVRKPCMEVFVNRMGLYPDKQIQRNMVVDELEGTKDKRDITLLRDYRSRTANVPDPPSTQVFEGGVGVVLDITSQNEKQPRGVIVVKTVLKELRECDPELCQWCGFVQTTKTAKCHNRKLQSGEVYPIIIGKTTWGQGAVAVEYIPSGAVIGEYSAELEPLNEGDDLREWTAKFDGLNYVFGLNQRFVLDSKYAGNETRYLNHNRDGPNCAAESIPPPSHPSATAYFEQMGLKG
ncbi:hypothetical protein BKA70DRAFT_1499013 [Coprinopsis sp. MPI-PUGE-AT-0042]|nr:hypothetical protein BKA70DRAFT_1499013 [Coprinopsis sp. MPI-PUGE-AT-0042]